MNSRKNIPARNMRFLFKLFKNKVDFSLSSMLIIPGIHFTKKEKVVGPLEIVKEESLLPGRNYAGEIIVAVGVLVLLGNKKR